MGRRKNEFIDVFKYIDIPTDGDTSPCWPWTGGTGGRDNDKRGYFTVGGVKYLSYRVVFKLVFGDLEDDEKVRHKCDNGLCCNPTHLIRGTQSDNELDKYERDRWGFPMSVIESIIAWSDKGLPQNAIAALVTEQSGIIVTQQRVSDIVTGNRRKRQADLVRNKT